ncbi:MAG: hypothetical protein JO157_16185 [Acetobacteraceae bacterium]|nr:hypothetical protein [Acetobacteraceae bacterium]
MKSDHLNLTFPPWTAPPDLSPGFMGAILRIQLNFARATAGAAVAAQFDFARAVAAAALDAQQSLVRHMLAGAFSQY